MTDPLRVTGRTLLALYFIVPGAMKFFDWDRHIALMELHNMPVAPALLALSGIVQLVAGLLLLLNRQVLASALVLAGLVLLINLNLHDFWNTYEGTDPGHELQNFIKNLAIMAGLLVLSGAKQIEQFRPFSAKD